MKCTPAKRIVRASTFCASIDSASESPQKIGDGLHFGQRIIVGEDHGSLAAFELFDAGEEVIDHLLFLFFNSILI